MKCPVCLEFWQPSPLLLITSPCLVGSYQAWRCRHQPEPSIRQRRVVVEKVEGTQAAEVLIMSFQQPVLGTSLLPLHMTQWRSSLYTCRHQLVLSSCDFLPWLCSSRGCNDHFAANVSRDICVSLLPFLCLPFSMTVFNVKEPRSLNSNKNH